jgi:hypothetical protein
MKEIKDFPDSLADELRLEQINEIIQFLQEETK